MPVMHERLTRVFESLGVDWEIIFVDSGSPDDTPRCSQQLAARDRRVTVVRHTTGIRLAECVLQWHASGDRRCGVLMDGDLQDPARVDPDARRPLARGLRGRLRRAHRTRGSGGDERGAQGLLSGVPAPGLRVHADRRRRFLAAGSPRGRCDQRAARDASLRAWPARVRRLSADRRALRAPERLFGRSSNNFLANLGWARRAIISFSYAPLDLIGWLAFFTTAVAILAAVGGDRA